MRRAILLTFVLLACGPASSEAPEATTTTTAAAAPSTSDTTRSPTTTGASSTTTQDPQTTTSTSASDTTDASTAPPDPATGDPCGDHLFQFDLSIGSTCDVLRQNCPCGQKCAPVGEELHCVPVRADQAAPGEPCTVDRLEHDDCTPGATCVGPGFNNFPTCVPLCDVDGVGCPADTQCVPGPGTTALDYGLCLRACDPLQPECPVGEECSQLLPGWFADTTSPFVCMPEDDASELFAPCNLPIDCAAGLACTGETPEPCGPDVLFGCCTPYCDLDAPNCPDPLACRAWYTDPPPGLEHVGVCLDP
jgi:hypothetical protein